MTMCHRFTIACNRVHQTVAWVLVVCRASQLTACSTHDLCRLFHVYSQFCNICGVLGVEIKQFCQPHNQMRQC